MNLREWLNQNPAFSSVAAVVVLIAALGFAVHTLTGGKSSVSGPKAVYYYDLVGGTIFSADPSAMPPIVTPSGNTIKVKSKTQDAGVRAFVMACGGCSGNLDGQTPTEVTASGGDIKYIQKYTEKAKRDAEAARNRVAEGGGAPPPMMLDMHMMGQLVASVPKEAGKNPRWVKSTSKEARNIFQRVLEKCPSGERPKPCFPQ